MTAPLSPVPQEYSERLRDQLRRLLLHFEEMRAAAPPTPGSWLPPVDVCELEEAVIVRLELPGVTAPNVKLSIIDGMLKIEGSKETATAIEGDKPLRYLCLERIAGTFVRRVPLKWTINYDRVTATLAKGILEIRLPKIEASGNELFIPIIQEREQ